MSNVKALERIFRFSGSTVVITGGGGELPGVVGASLAELGLQVALLDINEKKADERAGIIRNQGGTCLAFECDVLEPESVERAVAHVVENYGRIDYLLNAAGGNVGAGSTDTCFIDPETDVMGSGGFFSLGAHGLQSTFDLNVMGTVIPSQIIGRRLVESRRGSIVNFASMSALTPLTKVGAYSAAKAAVRNFTSWLAVHLSRTGVRVNAVAPGFFMTEQLRFLHIDEYGEMTARAREVIDHTPLGEYGEPTDLVGAIIWLLSDSARFVTGSTVVIDGGFSSYSI